MQTTNMSRNEFARLRTLENSIKLHRTHNRNIMSKRSAKGRGKGVGVVYKSTRVQYQVNVERVFNKPGWVKWKYV